MRKAILLFLPVLFSIMMSASAVAQPAETEMADLMRSNGKIYVVVAVLATILAGLILYLVSLDRRISKMERESN
jgi:hypothetical protein